ncbi:MAG: hypothetical protein ACFFDT_28245 [Candidatus Hodarchaeota archaeon]
MYYARIGNFNFKCEIKEIIPAIFPINSFHEIPMELPKGNLRKNIRGAYFRMGTEITQEEKVDEKKILKLPIYINSHQCLEEEISISEHKLIPEENSTPIIGIVERIEGCTGDDCASQRVTALVTWNDQKNVILELDWCEGNCEYSINPEWFLRSSEYMTLKNAIDIFTKKIGKICTFETCQTSIYVVPLALGTNLQGTKVDYENEVWQKEWGYTNPQEAVLDLENICNSIKNKKRA